ncbi:SH3 domain-containing protein [Coccidioides immitis RS]|uniref:SH3 domain-containing protein n=3 Tax=Coccidioides TaxID=5500 RepID=A0A0E1RWT9_COCIM|nr:SH3 domain-containing protein [Coccidioides immitis RS]EAS31074.1 SH3 domain-containing protein [Coccidioides immitis RS]KMM67586.1 cytokinesis protein Cyk3 [Coccidioides posadasii RMSCC 3488]KMP03674.1 cytokinesis protein Cyk3 [Coccidioides immitis RMSCC 2394]
MAPEAPQLPTKFPCWCRAIYSWGGETKRDLGFVEGDLIECLNAGDGSWWTGRLKRDRRMVGVFPSNFVKVLDEGFVPLSRSVSPLPLSAQVTPSNSTAGGPKKQKTVFRKPFQGYKEVVGPSGTLSKQSTPVESPLKTPVAQKQSMRKSRDPDRTPTTRRNEAPARPPSRAISPAPPPPPVAEPNDSPPPPPPPPHRILHRRSVSPQPQYYHQMQDNYPPRTPSPYPQSPIHGNTPSPLRDAIEDVMTSLHDMGLHRGDPSPEPPRGRSPFQPWSPDAYEQIHEHSAQGHAERPLTSLGLGGHDPFREHDFDYQQNSFNRYYDGPPQLGNYVERMESRLRQLHAQENKDELHLPPPSPPKKDSRGNEGFMSQRQRSLRNRKSISELNSAYLGRTHTTRSTTTNSSSGVQSVATNSTTSTGLTSQSLMSGTSAGGFSATSAASFARRSKVYGMSKDRPASPLNRPLSRGIYGLERGKSSSSRPQTPLTGISYHPSHDSRQGATSAMGWSEYSKGNDSPGLLGGLTTPKTKKTGFLKKILESAKTGAATARSNIASGQISRPSSPTKNLIQGGISSLSPTRHGKDASKEMGIGANDWVQVRRDVNRATTPSRNELIERAERCQMMEYPVIAPVTDLHEIGEGDEGIDGLPIAEPTNWNTVNLQLVDKSARFITSLPPMMNPVSLAQGYVCRPYRSDAQRLRAIFTWVGEKIAWDDDLDCDVDLRRVILMKRGCPHEVAVLVMEMCAAVGIHAEVVRGYLKTPGEVIDFDSLSKANHWWNAVLIDGEWRIMDCSLASPTHPRRSLYSSANSQAADSWYFLARPMEICYSHVPVMSEQQHICPPIAPEILLSLPCACPAFFKNGLHLPSYDTSLVQINGLETVQIRINVPPDVECAAEVEAIAFAHDVDGDRFESGDVVKKRALAQPDWFRGQKRFTIKAVLPGDEGQGVLKVYAGKKGLMHSSKDIPHPLAFALPIIHTGENPPYDFILRHPTPHAQRHDLYVIQPQCVRLAINNTFVFAVRQHPAYSPSTTSSFSEVSGRVSPNPFARPSSSLSMVSSIATASNASTTSASSKSHVSREKPAKLAVQTPSGKILRLSRKADHMITTSTATEWANDGTPDGSVWETVIKVSERGVWRGLVLADRSARWCVWGEWECV